MSSGRRPGRTWCRRARVTQQSGIQSVEDRDGMLQSGMEGFAPVGMAQLQDVARSL